MQQHVKEGGILEDHRFMAIVTLAESRFPAGAAVLAALNERRPGGNAELIVADDPQSAEAANSVMIKIGDRAYVCMFLAEPVPQGTMDLAASASHFWEDAAEQLAGHKAQIVVAELEGGEDFEARREGASRVMDLAAAVCICSLAPVIGIYWTNGETVTQPEPFVAEADRMGDDAWPAHVWAQYFWIADARTGNPGLLTHGLRSFIGREIEFEPGGYEQAVLFERTGQIVHFLLSSGPVLDHAETLGISETERIRVAHKPSGRRGDSPVLSLSLEQAEQPSG